MMAVCKCNVWWRHLSLKSWKWLDLYQLCSDSSDLVWTPAELPIGNMIVSSMRWDLIFLKLMGHLTSRNLQCHICPRNIWWDVLLPNMDSVVVHEQKYLAEIFRSNRQWLKSHPYLMQVVPNSYATYYFMEYRMRSTTLLTAQHQVQYPLLYMLLDPAEQIMYLISQSSSCLGRKVRF